MHEHTHPGRSGPCGGRHCHRACRLPSLTGEKEGAGNMVGPHTTKEKHKMKKHLSIIVGVLLTLWTLSIAGPAVAGGDNCVPKPAYDTTIHHDAVTHVVHHDAITHVVHHEAVTHIVHHDAVPAGPDLWWNWSPNDTHGPQDYEPAFPVDERGTWQGPHENGGPDQDTYGTFNVSNEHSGNSSWFHREHGTPAVDAYDEVVVDQEAYDETVVDQEAYDEIVIDQAAYDEVVHHPAVTCPDKPKPPVDTPPVNKPKPPVEKPNAPVKHTLAVPTSIDAGL